MLSTGCQTPTVSLLITQLWALFDTGSRHDWHFLRTCREGTVIAVDHDRYFVRQFAERVWSLLDGALLTGGDPENPDSWLAVGE